MQAQVIQILDRKGRTVKAGTLSASSSSEARRALAMRLLSGLPKSKYSIKAYQVDYTARTSTLIYSWETVDRAA